MDLQTNTVQEQGPSMAWLLFKIAVVILIVFVGIKYFSEKRTVDPEEEGYVERKKTKPKRKKTKDE